MQATPEKNKGEREQVRDSDLSAGSSVVKRERERSKEAKVRRVLAYSVALRKSCQPCGEFLVGGP